MFKELLRWIKFQLNPQAVRKEEIERLKQLAAQWHHLATCKFASAKRYREGEFGRKFIEHGAICYRNCAWELEREIVKLKKIP
jgi:hypothetical protein